MILEVIRLNGFILNRPGVHMVSTAQGIAKHDNQLLQLIAGWNKSRSK